MAQPQWQAGKGVLTIANPGHVGPDRVQPILYAVLSEAYAVKIASD